MQKCPPFRSPHPPSAHQLFDRVLQMLVALVDLIFGAAQSHNISFTAGLGEEKNDARELFAEFLDTVALRSDDHAVESIFDDYVATLFVLLFARIH